MNITLFSEVTTEQALLAIELEAEKYQGLYVDMNEGEQRKYVKQNASVITRVLAQVNRARIDLAKNYKIKVESEASGIIERLNKANEPFTLLLDDYNNERKRILDLEKERKAQDEAAIQKECDHEYAILLDKSYLADKLAAEKAQAERDEAIRVEATNSANDAAKRAQEVTDAAIEQDNLKRRANYDNVRAVNRAILEALKSNGVGEFEARTLITLVAKKQIPFITINY